MKVTNRRNRPHYRFPTRQAAEDAQAITDNQHHQQLRLARALYAGRVHWIDVPGQGPHRIGLFDLHTCGGPRLVYCFAPDTGQEPSLKVYDLDDDAWHAYRDWFFRAYMVGNTNRADRALADAIRLAETIVARDCPGAMPNSLDDERNPTR